MERHFLERRLKTSIERESQRKRVSELCNEKITKKDNKR